MSAAAVDGPSVAPRRTSQPALLIQLAAAVGALSVAVGVVLALVVAWWLGLLAALAVAGAAAAAVRSRLAAADDRVLGLVGPTREAGTATDARLLNLVEGLVAGAGVARPRCLVADDPAPNALAVGRRRGKGSVVVTSGLLDTLSRIELEGVLACLVVELRDGDTVGPTVELALRPGREPSVVPPARADLAAVALTRYPPGLRAGLRAMAAGSGPTAPAGAAGVLRPLWVAPPGGEAELAARIAALDEL